MGSVVCARSVWKEIPHERGLLTVVRDCSFDAGPGMTSLVGRSGAGKTSLLHVLSGLDAPTRGAIAVDGVEVYALSEARRTQFIRDRVGFVFQDANLVPYLTLEENAVLPLELAGRRVNGAQAQLDLLFTRFSLARSRRTKAEAASGARLSVVRSSERSSRNRGCSSPTNPPERWTRATRRLCLRRCDPLETLVQRSSSSPTTP